MDQNNNNNYEEVCSVCRRTESVAGEMIKMGKDICICRDCLQKSFDMVSEMSDNGQLGDLAKLMQGMPYTGMMPESIDEKNEKAGDADTPDEKKPDEKKQDADEKKKQQSTPRKHFRWSESESGENQNSQKGA